MEEACVEVRLGIVSGQRTLPVCRWGGCSSSDVSSEEEEEDDDSGDEGMRREKGVGGGDDPSSTPRASGEPVASDAKPHGSESQGHRTVK